MASCPNCVNSDKIEDEDPFSIKLLFPKQNSFSVHEWHYFISGHMLADIKWIAVLFLLFIAGRLSINL